MAGTSKINLQICPVRHRHHHHSHIRLAEFPLNRCVNSSGVFSSVRKEFPSLKPTIGSSSLSSNFSVFQGLGIGLALQHRLCVPWRRHRLVALTPQMRSGLIGKSAQKWWDKGTESPNMKEMKNAQHLVDSLLNAGDKLVVVDFFSPGCGGCKALHPKICQLAEMNPNVEFLKVNLEEHKSMCHSLNVHVLPFFRFYRGAHGRLCSFSCTNATIKKFKDALARHGTDRCSLGPPRGLEEKELLALTANKDLSFIYTPQEPSQLAAPLRSSPEEKETAATSLATPLASVGLISGRQPDLVVAGR